MEFCTCIIAERDEEELKKMKCDDCGFPLPVITVKKQDLTEARGQIFVLASKYIKQF